MRRASAGALCVALVGCAPTGKDDKSPGDSSAGSDVYFDADPPVPQWTAEQVGEQIEAFTASATPDPCTIANAFLGLMAQADDICPGQGPTNYQNPDGVLGCTATSGVHYQGVAWYYASETADDVLPLDWVHGGDFVIVDAAGASMSGGGEITYEADIEDDSLEFAYELYGSWVYEAATGWLGEGVSGVITASGSIAENASVLTLNGGVGVGGRRLDFLDFTATEATECPWEPSGRLGVRDEDGYWYDWTFELDCDPCADVVFTSTGELVGELCTDLAPWAEQMFEAQLPKPVE